jgi:polar amino acid transport system substrate-binding protein
MCVLIGELLLLDKDYLNSLYVSCLFHDIGKAHIDQDILNKKGSLDPEERDHIKKHPVYSSEEMKSLGYSEEVARIIRHHHENYDGSGYPDGIGGSLIPVGSRILKVVDIFDALTMERPYRKRLSHKEAIRIMEKEKHHFDPKIYDLFLTVISFRYKKHLKESDAPESKKNIGKLISMNEWTNDQEMEPIDPSNYSSIRKLAHEISTLNDLSDSSLRINHTQKGYGIMK